LCATHAALGGGKKIPPCRFGGDRLRGNDSALSASFHGLPFCRRQKPAVRVSFDPATYVRTLSFGMVIPHKFRNYTLPPGLRPREMVQIFTVDPVATVILKYCVLALLPARLAEQPAVSGKHVWLTFFSMGDWIRHCYVACVRKLSRWLSKSTFVRIRFSIEDLGDSFHFRI